MNRKAFYVGICLSSLIFISACKKDENPANTQGTTITVNGFVKDAADQPVSGITIFVPGKPITASGVDGSFSITNVTVPYDLTMIQSAQTTALVYKGLTRTDPVLYLTGGAFGSAKTATITGTVPAASTKIILVFFVSDNITYSTNANASGAYSLNLSWFTAPTSLVGKVYVLRWTSVAIGFPVAYDAFGSKDITVAASGSSVVNFTTADFTDPAEQTISGTVTRPASTYSIYVRHLWFDIGNARLYLTNEGGAAPFPDGFNISAPVIPGLTFAIDNYARQPAVPNDRISHVTMGGFLPGTNNIALALRPPPQLNSPVHNGTNVDTNTVFSFTSGSSTGIYSIYLLPTSGTQPRFTIYTSALNVTIPNLSSLGLGLPSSANYTWSVSQRSLSSTDDIASKKFIQTLYGDNWNASSGGFTFTTKP